MPKYYINDGVERTIQFADGPIEAVARAYRNWKLNGISTEVSVSEFGFRSLRHPGSITVTAIEVYNEMD